MAIFWKFEFESKFNANSNRDYNLGENCIWSWQLQAIGVTYSGSSELHRICPFESNTTLPCREPRPCSKVSTDRQCCHAYRWSCSSFICFCVRACSCDSYDLPTLGDGAHSVIHDNIFYRTAYFPSLEILSITVDGPNK